MRPRWLVAVVLASRLPAQTTALTDVTVIEVATGTRQLHRTVVLTGSTIAEVGPNGRVTIPRGARRVNGAGKFLIPGLWDMHVHLSMIGRSALGLFLANGVTGVRDMGGNPGSVLGWRDSVAAGTLSGPRMKVPGNIVESARWLDNVVGLVQKIDQPELLAELRSRFGLNEPADAERAVDSLAGLGVDFVKIRNYPAPATYAAFTRRARERGLRIAGHAPPPEYLALVSDSGIASLEHSLIGAKDGKLANAFAILPESAALPMMRRFAANQTAWSPTLVSTRARFVPDSALQRIVADSTGVTDPLLRYVSPRLRAGWRASLALEPASERLDYTDIFRADLRDVRRMADNGVVILAGTDVAVITLVPGFSLHDELELLVVGGGLTPAEALAAATINPAKVLGIADRTGRVAAGQWADLVLLDADPLHDIRATRGIRAVVAAGRYLDRAALDRTLESAAVVRPR